MTDKKIIVVSRAVIADGEKMLLVVNRKNNFYCLPGGRKEFGEDPKQALEREMVEELGVKPEIGGLLYVQTFNDGETEAVGFFYEVLNVADYKNIENLKGTHSFELSKMAWLERTSTEKVLPNDMWQDFKNNDLPKDKERYISG